VHTRHNHTHRHTHTYIYADTAATHVRVHGTEGLFTWCLVPNIAGACIHGFLSCLRRICIMKRILILHIHVHALRGIYVHVCVYGCTWCSYVIRAQPAGFQQIRLTFEAPNSIPACRVYITVVHTIQYFALVCRKERESIWLITVNITMKCQYDYQLSI
jgi:hypothetical protein